MAASINQGTVINNIEFAQKALEIHDIIPVLHFSRLVDMLANTEGRLDCRLQGGKDANNAPYIRLLVQGTLSLNCQRCLQPFEHEILIDTHYILVRNESDMPAPEDESDEEDYLLIQAEMPVLELMEDELLLALPIAPKHEEGECDNQGNTSNYKKPNPFAKLELLKSKK
jgi:uncharacterized protein